MTMFDPFLINLSSVLAHSMLLDAKGPEPVGEAWARATLVGQFAGGMLQQKPDVPDFKPINTTDEQRKAVQGNIANFGEISKLAGQANAFNQAELDKMLEAAVPGYKSMVSGIGAQISKMVNGEIPADVSAQIGRNSAFKSLSGGFGGSGMARNLVARDLGMTSLDIIGKGIDAGSRWLATARQSAVAPQFDVASMFVSPKDRIGVEMWNRQGKFEQQWLENQVDAEYDWRTTLGRSIATTDSQITNAAFSMAGSAAGGAI
jgi:hypothetical protein